MKQTVDLGNDQERHCPLDTFPLNVARLTSFVSRAFFAVIDDTECHDGLSMTVLSWMYRNDRCAPNVGYCCFGALERTDSKVTMAAVHSRARLGERRAAFRAST